MDLDGKSGGEVWDWNSSLAFNVDGEDGGVLAPDFDDVGGDGWNRVSSIDLSGGDGWD